MSFTETNVNELRDDIENKIANVDRIATWKVIAAQEQYVLPHSEISLNYQVQKNGITVDEKPVISLTGNLVEQDGKIFALEEGEGKITFSTHEQTFIQQIHISSDIKESPMYLFGDDKVRVSMEANYELQGADQIVSFSVSNNTLATIKQTSQNTCVLITNSKNQLGDVDLIATCGDKTYKKTIKIVPIWQVM